MSAQLIPILSKQLNLPSRSVQNTLTLLDEGATVPFISRYRKEMTGSLDEVQVGNVKEAYQRLQELLKRRQSILESIREQGQLTAELEEKISNTWSATELEDIYLPYKPKRKTRASVAREKGLEPLAGTLMKQDLTDVYSFAERFTSAEVADAEEALAGARDIMAEWINERAYARNTVRRLFEREATITSKLVKGKEEEGAKYSDYFKFSEALKRIPSHRMLALRRAEEEGIIRVSIAPPEEKALDQLERIFVKGRNEAAEQVKMAVKDAYKRLLAPSIETEFRNSSKEKADTEAIAVFAENLRQLLLTPPLGPKRILAIDPGFRTGCKVVCLDEQGNLLHNENIYPHPPQSEGGKAAAKISNLVEAYKVETIAIGNGTAGRETEDFIQKRLRLKKDVTVFMVNEAGASVYSASKVAREEFPTYDVTVRGAVSIGRRLMDPLAELVKIDPKSIGVGQYQHDVDQNQLKKSLDTVVESVVNQVGVNLNTASKHLLNYISGLGPKLAETIVEHRAENGAFQNRKELLNVKGLGPKAYEQAAGFLRIPDGDNPLDNSAVHPESYTVVKRMAKDMGVPVERLIGSRESLQKITLNNYVTDQTGLPTLKDIVEELAKVGRDPRGKVKVFSFDPNIRKVEDLKEGMILPGLVTNITRFGAFVDVGAKQDGLVHISQLADRFVSDPNEIVRLNQEVQVKVLEVDIARKRIQLSMKEA
ncbi:MAG TPA: RNA-binding transcriptional accessory protein [Cryomorphaceae bacterium]|nr:RNA-binding transcriptional accessory protein [Owenweeksia sp.]MBG00622.1 RNA-binding transcriptional accessory protein [Owenweeksia sp.]HAD98013.1 RNA-binding transcriptional accessory protein [Cryomorphaceae bacterium]